MDAGTPCSLTEGAIEAWIRGQTAGVLLPPPGSVVPEGKSSADDCRAETDPGLWGCPGRLEEID